MSRVAAGREHAKSAPHVRAYRSRWVGNPPVLSLGDFISSYGGSTRDKSRHFSGHSRDRLWSSGAGTLVPLSEQVVYLGV